MQDFLELPNNPSLFALSCDVIKGKFEPVIKAEEAYQVSKTCENPFRKNIVTCKDIRLSVFVDEVQGLDLDTELQTVCQELPFYIPVFDKNVKAIPNISKEFPFVALSLNDITSSGIIHKAGCLHEEKSVALKGMMLQTPCFKNSKIILFSSGADNLIESVWYKRDDIKFFNRIAKMGFYAATGFNFSLFVGECSFSHALNMKRSLASSSLYEQAGVLTIPHMYALNKFQVARWCAWLKSNPSVSYFTVNCQIQRSKQEIAQVVQAIRSILKSVPSVHVLVHGFPIDKIKAFENDILRVHFADMLPLKKAFNYRRMVFDAQNVKLRITHDDSVSIAELVAHNFSEKRMYIDYVRKQMIVNYKLQAKSVA
ncbi:MAG: hypothetical protein V4520_08770 [Bacteroidota bacterium]